MKNNLNLGGIDLKEFNCLVTTPSYYLKPYPMLDIIFVEKDKLIKCSITVDDKE